MECFEKKLKLISLEMLAHREMENPTSLLFKNAQMTMSFSALDLFIYRWDGGT